MPADAEVLPHDADVVDGHAVEEHGTEIVRAAAPTLAVTPTVTATELVQRLDTIREAQHKAMVKDVDYGVIPGTNKPTLLKPGAEKLAVLFQLDVQLVNERIWGPGDHLTVLSRATVYHAPTGTRLGFGEGTCSTKEKKYGKRQQARSCPNCGKEAIIKGKAEYGGGWLCFKKKDGCGAKYRDGDPQIEGQPVGEIENPDLPDLWNTVVKMAEKRARVDAVLAVTGASALFTQDAEDIDQHAPPVEVAMPRDEPAPRPQPQQRRQQAAAPATDVPAPEVPVAAEPIKNDTHIDPSRTAELYDRLKARRPTKGILHEWLNDVVGAYVPREAIAKDEIINTLSCLSPEQADKLETLIGDES